jgi:DNA-binding CsgD family transcriptional regulator
LFVQRARAVQPSFALSPNNARSVAELCSRLDGLPLAIELAAARTRLLPPAVLLSRLERRLDLQSSVLDAPARHRTLREAIAWSYDLLTLEQQALFRRLSVFVGGCTLEAAERVCFPRERHQELAIDVFEGMYALVERNLLTTEEAGDLTDDEGDPLVRFRFLETVREYALEQLELSGEDMWVRAAHAAYYLALAEAAEPAIRGPRQRIWLDRLEQDWDNLRAVLRWLLDRGDASALDNVGRLAWALWHFWWARGYLGEGRRWCNELLGKTATTNAGANPRTRARAAWVIATAALDQGDYQAAPPLIAESLAIFDELGDMRGMARGLLAEGWAAPIEGDLERALAVHQQSVECFREAADEQGVVLALAGLANTATLCADLTAATTYNEEALALARKLGDTHSQAQVHEALGLVALQQHDLELAAFHFGQSVPLCRAVGSLELLCYCLVGLAGVAYAGGRSARAATLLGAAEGLRERADLGVWPVRQSLHAQLVRDVRSVPAMDSAWSAGWQLDAERAARLALADDTVTAESPSGVASVNVSIETVGLTAREREVAALIGRGMTSKEIADALVITERTADTHAAHIREKLSLRSRAEIAAWATRSGLVRAGSS